MFIWSWLVACAHPSAATPARGGPFDGGAAWAELEQTLRGTYAYLDRDDFDVDAHLTRVGRAAALAADAASFRRIALRGTYAFADPHLLVTPLADDDLNVWPTSGDLAITAIGDRFVVADVRAGSAADDAGVRPGWRLIEADGAAITEAVAALLAEVDAPSDAQRGYAATLLANGRRVGDRLLRFDVSEVALANPRALARVVAERPPLGVTWHGDVVVIRLENSLGRMETIPAFDEAIEAAASARAVVLDARNTPSGGNTDVARAILGHFVAEPRPYQMHTIPAVARETSVPRQFVEYVLPRAPRVEVPVVVLGGRWTGSMGEGVVIGMSGAAGARTFASDMGDLRGALHSFDLERSGATLELGAEALFHVDGTPREAYVADVPLERSDRDAQGGDPALDAALGWLAAG